MDCIPLSITVERDPYGISALGESPGPGPLQSHMHPCVSVCMLEKGVGGQHKARFQFTTNWQPSDLTPHDSEIRP
jgi:hypothetical protein